MSETTEHCVDHQAQAFLKEIMPKLEATTEESWCTGIVRSRDGVQNCLLGHIFAMGKDDRESNRLMDKFEYLIGTSYMIYPVNDGEHPGFTQATPKQRCLSYLRAMQDGTEDTVEKMMLTDYGRSQRQPDRPSA